MIALGATFSKNSSRPFVVDKLYIEFEAVIDAAVELVTEAETDQVFLKTGASSLPNSASSECLPMRSNRSSHKNSK